MTRSRYLEAPADIARAIKAAQIIGDDLPALESLVFKEEDVKVTLELGRRSVSLFKKFAKARGLKYQRMIRSLVDHFVERKLAHHRQTTRPAPQWSEPATSA